MTQNAETVKNENASGQSARKAAIEILRSSALCRDMSTQELEDLASGASVSLKRYEKGQYIFHQGETPRYMYVLGSGRVGINRVTASGRSLLVEEISDAGDIFGEVYLFLGHPYGISTEILEEALVVRLDSFAFEGSLSRNLLTLFARKAFMLSKRVQILASPSIREKVARFIMEFSDENGMTPEMSRELMADYMGVTRPSLSRELAKLKSQGIIDINGKSLRAIDREALDELL